MPLSISQIKAASALARGSTDTAAAEAAGVCRATFYKWQKTKPFKDAVALFTSQEIENQSKLAAAVSSNKDVATSYQDEIWLKNQIKKLLEAKIQLTTDLLERIEAEDISPRQLPQLIQGITQLIESFRNANDRISGLEDILSELSRIEKEREKKIISIASANDSEAA